MKLALLEQQRGTLITASQQLLGAYLTQWLEEVHRPPVIKVSSHLKYRKLMNTYIIPALGRIPLQKLTPQHVQRFHNQKLEDGLHARTIISIHNVLHQALEDAVRWNLVARNVCDVVMPPKAEKYDITPLTLTQAQAFLASLQGHRLEALFLLAIITGMRKGELLGLRWSDIHFEQQYVRVRRTVSYIEGRGYIETEPKTAKGRWLISLPPFALDKLRQHRLQQVEQRSKVANNWEERDLVFCNQRGDYLDPRYLSRLFARLLKKADLPHIRFHDLRHSAATIMLSMGVHFKVIHEILGHSSSRITLDIYAHVLPAMHEEAMSGWKSVLGEAQ
ncbi:site-specific integrase [Ktedonobacter sp. SOSP1-85]|uniref:tyrosine-type recombinase/integrase n=1 Tax=Ktedonobacter sp. SOSP1-85 TaxID=2778367 RepID=UPI001915C896|nr:tyrosine-type recombinase/integrase [Ktedonobacter sp. SOSP1-85]GHO77967.1 site-specific integrase [Ktedonobacter sp. SOSP1-85]